MVRKMKNPISIAILSLVALTLVGCGPLAPRLPDLPPTPTPITITVDGQVIVLVPGVNILPEIYEAIKSPEILEHSDWVLVDGYWDLMPKGAEIPLEVLEPLPETARPSLFPGFPETWAAFTLPGLPVSFDYPADWQIEALENGAAFAPADGSFLFRVDAYPDPVGTSLGVWLAEYGPDLPGQLLAQNEDMAAGQPVVLERVLLPGEEGSPEGEFFRLWIAQDEWVILWTAGPGERPETYDLLMYITSTLR